MLATNAGLLTPILGDPSPWTPQRLYTNGEAGLYYEPADLTAEKVAWRRNLLTWSEAFDNAAWTKSAGGGGSAPVVTANDATAPDGTTTADRVVFAAPVSGDLSFLTSSVVATTAAVSYRQAVYIKAYAAGDIGKIMLVRGPASSSYTQVTLTAVWQLVAWNENAAGGNRNVEIGLRPSEGSSTGTVTVHLWGAMMSLASVNPTYQRITDFTSDFLAAFPTHTLYQDSAGTTPVTALGQPVGLVIDKSRGALANLGSELRSTGAVGLVGTATAATYNTTTGAGTMVRVDASNQSYIEFTGLSNAALYRVEIANTGAVSLTLRTGNYVGTPVISIAAGSTGIALAQPTSGALTLVTGTGTGAFTVVSVRVVPGVHAIQPTSASRPALDARVNLLLASEDFTAAAWTLLNPGTRTANTDVAPDGTTTADTITDNQAAALSGVRQIVTVATANRQYVGQVCFKKTSGATSFPGVSLWFSGGSVNLGSLALNTNTGVATAITGEVPDFITVENLGTYWRVTLACTNAGGNNSLRFDVFAAINTTGGGTYDVAAQGSAVIWGADVRLATDAAYPYQRVVTATDYADVGVPRSFLFDGFDDSLYTASTLDLSGTDKVTVWAGVYKNSDASGAILAELSADSNTNNGSFYLTAPSDTGAAGNFGLQIGGTNRTLIKSGTVLAPVSRVYAGTSDISAPSAVLRLNGVQSASTTSSLGTGNFGNYVFFIARRNNASNPFNGKLYIPVVRGAQTDAATLALTERYVGSRMGIVL